MLRKAVRKAAGVDGGRFEEGDSVEVIKPGSNYGKLATVVDPDWQGRVQVMMGDAVKSYLPTELQAASRVANAALLQQ